MKKFKYIVYENKMYKETLVFFSPMIEHCDYLIFLKNQGMVNKLISGGYLMYDNIKSPITINRSISLDVDSRKEDTILFLEQYVNSND